MDFNQPKTTAKQEPQRNMKPYIQNIKKRSKENASPRGKLSFHLQFNFL